MKKVKRTFTSLVRMPYQDAIAVTLHCYDFHMEMSVKEPEHKHFHLKQAMRLKDWLTDIKEYILKHEETHNSKPTNSEY